MADNEPTEKTPKGHEVPVPKRGEFFGNLKKAARPSPTPQSTREQGIKPVEQAPDERK